jgi:geranylgeranyl diphosphate synthase, type II
MPSLEHYISIINTEITQNFLASIEEPKELYKPVEYILSNGGKRIRAVMTLIAANLFTEDIYKALAPALGIEVFHNFTLLHDDIMDKATIRRGNPTVHLKWDENTAILSGDAMMILANKLIAQAPINALVPVLQTFNKTALEVCEGQQYDMNLEQKDVLKLTISESEYLEMIKLKTSVLIGASLKVGALCGGASIEQADILYNYGLNIGLAFQIQDDLLDTFGNEAEFGKRIGGDIIEGKKTYLLIVALENASKDDASILKATINKTDISDEEKISIIKTIYIKTKAKEIAEKKIESYFETAKKFLDQLNFPNVKLKAIMQLEASLKKRIK